MPAIFFKKDILLVSLMQHQCGSFDYIMLFVNIGWGIKLYPHWAGFLGVACYGFSHCSFPPTFTLKSLLAILCL